MLLHKVRVDAQTHEWVVRMLAAETAEDLGAAGSGSRSQLAREGVGETAGGAGRPDASDVSAAADEPASGS